MKKITRIIILLTLLVNSYLVKAMDTRTHLYIANEVYKDLIDDGRVDLPPFGSFAVNSNYVEYIKNNKDAFLLGALGPDSVPDMIAGQITTHAGVDGGWNTNDWLKHLTVMANENANGRAFYQGYLTHAASDIFAHTYVNAYSGDAFDLADDDKLDVELRHFVLEKYIGNHLPYNINSGLISSPSTVNVNKVIGYRAANQTEKWEIILNEGNKYVDAVYTQLEPHSSLIELIILNMNIVNVKLWIALKRSDTFFLTWPSVESFLNAVDEQLNIAGINTRYIDVLDLWPTVSFPQQPIMGNVKIDVYSSSNSVQANIRTLTNNFIRNNAVSNQYNISKTTSYLYKMDKFEERIEEEAEFINVLKRWIRNELSTEFERRAYLTDLRNKYEENSEVKETKPAINTSISNGLPEANVCNSNHPEHKVFARLEPQVYDAWLAGTCKQIIKTRYSRKVNAMGLNELYNKFPELVALGQELGIDKLTHEEAVQMLALVAGAIIFYEALDFEALAIDYALAKYLEEAVNEATEAYIFANINTAKLIIDQKNIEEIITPLKVWLTCYGPIYTSELAAMPDICSIASAAKGATQELATKLKESAENIAKHTGLTEEALAIYKAYQDFNQRMEDLAKELGKDIVRSVLTDEQKAFINVLRTSATDAALNNAFMRTGYSQNLLQIPDMAIRVKADMHLTTAGQLDPTQFGPIYNAIQLSKLSLLDENAINQLEQKSGLSAHNYSGSYANNNFNLLFSWVASLDGNHQWMDVSPKLPRAEGYTDNTSDQERKYSVGSGFMLWRVSHRANVFNQLFKGPLNESLEDPLSVGVLPVLPSSYGMRNCYSAPFIESEQYQSCLPFAAILVPILNLLN